jgi:membrane protease YdiL (CAAX protease family)
VNDAADVRTPLEPFAQRLTRGQVLFVLVGFPLLYWVNHLTPWNYGLFRQGDRSWYPYFAGSIIGLHWLTLLAMVLQVRRAGGSLTDIGLKLSPARAIIALIVFVLAGGGLLWLRTTWPLPDKPPEGWQIIYPFTWSERMLMLFASFSAGVCEELIYRGYALTVLRGRGIRLWLALLLSGLSFALMHGIPGVILLPMYLIVHAIFAGIYLGCRSLWPVIYVHVLWDMMMVLAV